MKLLKIKNISNSGEKGSIFTGALYEHYGDPAGFCFDVLCGDAPIIDNPKSFEYNVPERVRTLLIAKKKINAI